MDFGKLEEQNVSIVKSMFPIKVTILLNIIHAFKIIFLFLMLKALLNNCVKLNL